VEISKKKKYVSNCWSGEMLEQHHQRGGFGRRSSVSMQYGCLNLQNKGPMGFFSVAILKLFSHNFLFKQAKRRHGRLTDKDLELTVKFYSSHLCFGTTKCHSQWPCSWPLQLLFFRESTQRRCLTPGSKLWITVFQLNVTPTQYLRRGDLYQVSLVVAQHQQPVQQK